MSETFNRRVVLKRALEGEPKAADFGIDTAPVPEPGPGEILIRTQWLSLDPYMRLGLDPAMGGQNAVRIGTPMVGSVVGEVVASRSDVFAVGDSVEARANWAEYGVVADNARKLRKLPKLSRPSNALGAAGMTGVTAHTGMIQKAAVKAGETVVVSAAGGAVGSVAGQIGKILGARVVGIAGGEAKCRAVEALGFDACVDYHAPDFAERLKAATPDGIDVYFENVGGAVTRTVLPLVNYGARMPVSGFIAYYGRKDEDKGPDHLPDFYRTIMMKALQIYGYDGATIAAPNVMPELIAWVESGKIKPLETIVEGLDAAPAAFASIFGRNANVGKVLVHVAD